MFKTRSFGFGGAMALVVALAAPAANAATPHYRYVALDKAPLPAPFTFFDPSVVIDGRVFGTVFDPTLAVANVAVYDHGTITIGPAGRASVANDGGVIGGANTNNQAALFNGNATTLIPILQGLAFSSVVGLNDADLALVAATNDAFFGSTYSYFRFGKQTLIDFGVPDPVFNAFMNRGGFIGFTKQSGPVIPLQSGYRYDPIRRKSVLLQPFPGDGTDTLVLVQGINTRGEVLGYSRTNDAAPPVFHERVGVWDGNGVFHPFFFEKIATDSLVFNDDDQIVITNDPSNPGPQVFLVPEPGTRIDLSTLVNVPAGLTLSQAESIDNEGNITGISLDANQNAFGFLLIPIAP